MEFIIKKGAGVGVASKSKSLCSARSTGSSSLVQFTFVTALVEADFDVLLT